MATPEARGTKYILSHERVKDIRSLVMHMWLDDHPGPHFHAHHDGKSISVYIRTLEVEEAIRR